MPDRPLLKLPTPVDTTPKAPPTGRDNVVRPNRARQDARINPRFERLEQVVDNPAQIVDLRADPASIAPERAIVFEVEGSVEDFYAQATALGLEYLGEYEEDFEPTQDFFNKKHPDKEVSGRIYLAMPDVRALQELLSLWKRYKEGRNMPKGKGPWRELFDHLVDVRPWGAQDRLPSETIEDWEDDLARNPAQPVRLEIELWFHDSPERRAAALARVRGEITTAGGEVVDHAVVSDIRYDGVLADVPAQHIRRLIDQRDVALVLDDEIMFLKPQSVAEIPASTEFEGAEVAAAPAAAPVAAQPLAALLDGFPVQNHVRLANRLLIDDPDNLEPLYPVARRAHGTEMASLIIHGDLSHGGAPITRPLYVRPVLRPTPNGERTPADRLLVDVIYQAVRRMKEGDGATPATAPSVAVINLSLADDKRPFARMMSPLGRLLDYLAYRYRVLFLVSAGNVLHRLPVPGFANLVDFEAATPEAREEALLHGLNAQKGVRTLFCPAEAMNILTIGAAHSGSGYTGTFPAGRFDPFTNEDLPNIISAMGLGYKKAVKPELLFAGGRAPVHVVATGAQLEVAPVTGGVHLFGVKAARPRAASLSYEDFTWGTSVATALATRAAHLISDVILDAGNGSNHADLEPEYLPLVLKALMVHGAKWGDKGELLENIFGPKGTGSHLPRRDDIARLLGYGVPDIQRVLDCTENRATLLGWGTILADQHLLYRIPLPPEIESNVAVRDATVTLAWFSPINARHKGYRMAVLELSAGGTEKHWIVDDRVPTQPTDKAAARGTVIHERRRGDKAKVFVEDGHMLLRVSCRAGAGDMTDAVPYAIAVSFEVAATAGIPVYQRIRDRLRTPIQPQPPA